jgi:four helix bundle protein
VRDHTKLRAFELADELSLMIYRATKAMPRDERFGLTMQMRRAAISIASNIVEGCARSTQRDYLHFLDMAYGSACELQYQVSLAFRLEYLDSKANARLDGLCMETVRVLNALIRSLRQSE